MASNKGAGLGAKIEDALPAAALVCQHEATARPTSARIGEGNGVLRLIGRLLGSRQHQSGDEAIGAGEMMVPTMVASNVIEVIAMISACRF